MKKTRLQKVLARAGFGSRRGCEEIISSGKVTVNGKIAKLGCSVDADDEIKLGDKRVELRRVVHKKSVFRAREFQRREGRGEEEGNE